MSRMAIAALGLALLGTTACENLMSSESGMTQDSRSTTPGGAAPGNRGSDGPATEAPRTSSSDKSSPGDLTRQGKIPGEDMLN
jgi:hypothetical protein